MGKKTISEQRTEMESRLKLDNGHLLEEMNNLMSSINGNANRISGVEESLKSSADELSTKMTNDLQNLEKSSIGRLVDLETAISKYHEKILANSSSINENKTMIESAFTNISNQYNSLAQQVEVNTKDLSILKESQGNQLMKVTDLEGKVKLNTDCIKNIDDTLDGLKNSINMHEGKHIETVEKMKKVTEMVFGVEQDLEEKIKGINNSSGGISDKISSLENDSKSH